MGLAGAPLAAQVLVTTGTVEDRRTTGQFFGGLEIELKLTGDDLADAKASRVLVKKAVDATGRDLLPESPREEDFRDASGGGSSLKVSLKNPARGAAAVREVAGEIQLFVPTRDPAATASVDKFLSRVDKPLSAPGLKSAKIDVRLVSPKTYKANLEKSQAEMEKEMEKHRAEMLKEAEKEGVDPKQADAIMELAKGLMGMMGDVGENDLVFQIQDEQKMLHDIEVVTRAGKKIDRNGAMSSGDLRILHFTEKLPADARLRFLIRTDKSVQRSPFAIKDVPLP
jgi:hypothetical protein